MVKSFCHHLNHSLVELQWWVRFVFCLLNTDYYSNVNKNKDDSKKYLKWYSRFDSDYVKTLSNDPIGVRYESPTSAKGKFNEYEYKHNPDVLRFTKVGKRSLAKSTLIAPNTIPNMRPRNDIWTTSYQDTSESLSNKVWFMIIMQIQIDKGNHIEDKVNKYCFMITLSLSIALRESQLRDLNGHITSLRTKGWSLNTQLNIWTRWAVSLIVICLKRVY